MYGWYLPEAQLVHELARAPLYVPAPQVLGQELWPVYRWYLPEAQLVQGLKPVSLYVPAPQELGQMRPALLPQPPPT